MVSLEIRGAKWYRLSDIDITYNLLLNAKKYPDSDKSLNLLIGKYSHGIPKLSFK